MKKFVLVIIGVFLVLTYGCKDGGNSGRTAEGHKAVGLDYSSMINLSEMDSGWILAEIVNPWDTTRLLQTLALIPEGLSGDLTGIPSSAVRISIPLKESLVTSSVHIGLFEELGVLEQIAGVTDVAYIMTDSFKRRIERGEVADCGTWMAPDIERVIKLNPDAIIISPYQDGGNYARLAGLSIPVIYAADYMENSPLGRAEWMKFYGLLYGREQQADSLFKSVESRYLNLKDIADSASMAEGRPSVMLDTPYMGAWYIHGSGSTNDCYINDAGAKNPFSDMAEGNSIGISPETFLMEAKDTDVWLLRYNTKYPMTLRQLESDNPLYTRFHPFQTRNVWGCNTSEVPFYDETPFHPEYLLEDLIRIFHPSAIPPGPLRYFSKLK